MVPQTLVLLRRAALDLDRGTSLPVSKLQKSNGVKRKLSTPLENYLPEARGENCRCACRNLLAVPAKSMGQWSGTILLLGPTGESFHHRISQPAQTSTENSRYCGRHLTFAKDGKGHMRFARGVSPGLRQLRFITVSRRLSGVPKHYQPASPQCKGDAFRSCSRSGCSGMYPIPMSIRWIFYLRKA
jgi:hypothetical protein